VILHDMEQGSPEWFAARRGVPTASQFHRILTPKTLKMSSQADGYMNELLAEWLIGETCDGSASSGWMERGNDLEPLAARWYAFEHDVDVQTVGFATTDDGLIGGSPDRLVGEDGGLEIKCPAAKVHVAHLRGLDAFAKAHWLQIQGGMWVCERAWWDILSYNPVLPSAELRVPADPKTIDALRESVTRFVQNMLEARDKLIKSGCEPVKAEIEHAMG
jgi:hypothetical protein